MTKTTDELKPKNPPDEYTEFISGSGPICVYCGHEHDADEEIFYKEGDWEMNCDKCGEKLFVRSYQLGWRWETRKDEGWV